MTESELKCTNDSSGHEPKIENMMEKNWWRVHHGVQPLQRDDQLPGSS
jgi:hypothetical protein